MSPKYRLDNGLWINSNRNNHNNNNYDKRTNIRINPHRTREIGARKKTVCKRSASWQQHSKILEDVMLGEISYSCFIYHCEMKIN